MKENNYCVRMNEDEFVEVVNLLNKMREEKAKQQAIKEQEMQISAAVEVAISVIGLEETKRIMRKMIRALRETEKVETLPF